MCYGDRYVNSNNRTICYIDANNLYGYPLMQKLPYKDFEYITATSSDEEETMLQSTLNTPDDSDYGYWVICDLE